MANGKILIVESSATRGKALALILGEIGGYEARHVLTVMDALKEIRDQSFDLIATNTAVDRAGDGIKLAQIVLLRAAGPHPPLMMVVTLDQDRELVKQARRAGVMDYVIYPYDPEDLLKRVRDALGQKQGMTKNQVRRAVVDTLKKIMELPTVAAVHDKIETLLNDNTTSADDVAKVIEVDQSITAKVLRLANSAQFGAAHHVTSAKEAVTLMGFQQVGDLISAVTTFGALGRVEESRHFDRMAFWQHSIACAAIAKVMAVKMEIDPDRAFVAGILHDVGKVIMDGYFPEYFSQALELAQEKGMSIHQAEKECLPVTHEIVGRYLAGRWNLPEALVEVIGAHNSLSLQKSAHARLVQLIHVADAQCRLLGVGNAGDHVVWQPEPTVLAQLRIGREDLAAWKAEMSEEVQKARSVLDLI